MVSPAETRKIRQMFLSSIRVLAEALEAKDPYTAGHSKRVAQVSANIASAMNLSPPEIGSIRLAAMLHDIGKIGVRESVLNKQGELTPEEYAHVMQHSEIGRRILEPIFHGTKVLEIVAHHHDHFDGGPAMDGPHGEEIPLGARIVAVADAVDAMASPRPYRPSLTPSEIGTELRGCSGTQFDPDVVTAFFATPEGMALLQDERQAPSSPGAAGQAAQIDAGAPAAVVPEEPTPEPTRTEYAIDAARAAVEPVPQMATRSPMSPPPRPLLSQQQVLDALSRRQEVKALPFVTAELLELTSRPDSDTHALTQAILHDPMLVARILKLANTAYYASKGRVQTVERAVVNIGHKGIREIVMGVAVVNLFDHKGTAVTVDRFALWRHNLAAAALCRAFAAKGGRIPTEDAFVGGLLHDLGIAVLDDMFPNEYASCVAFAKESGARLVDAEDLFMDVQHTLVGAELSKVWKIAEKFRMPMAMHHMPWPDVLAAGAAVTAVKFADILAKAMGAGIDCDDTVEEAPDEVLNMLNVSAHDVDMILDALPMELAELEAIFLMHESVERYTVDNSRALSGLAGRRTLFIEAPGRKIDVMRILFSHSDGKTTFAREVFTGCAVDRPDVVVLSASDASALIGNLKQLRELSAIGAVGRVRVLVLGRPPGEAASIYPVDLTAAVDQPYSIPAIEAKLTALFSDGYVAPAAA